MRAVGGTSFMMDSVTLNGVKAVGHPHPVPTAHPEYNKKGKPPTQPMGLETNTRFPTQRWSSLCKVNQ